MLSIGTASGPLVKPETGQILAACIRIGHYCSKSPSLRACVTAWLRTGSAGPPSAHLAAGRFMCEWYVAPVFMGGGEADSARSEAARPVTCMPGIADTARMALKGYPP